MEVESMDASANNAPKNKVWLIVLGILGVIIVGLVIAIAVVKSLPKGGSNTGGNQNTGKPDKVELEDYTTYDATISEISDKIEADQIEGEDLLKLYKTYIDKTDDIMIKSMLESDYYLILMQQDTELQKKDKVLDELIRIDDILKTEDSALIVSMAATYYQDDSLIEKYNNIANERALTEERVEDGETWE